MGTKVDAVLSELIDAGAAQREAHEAERKAVDAKFAAIFDEQTKMFERHNAEANDHNTSFQKKLDAAIKADRAADNAKQA